MFGSKRERAREREERKSEQWEIINDLTVCMTMIVTGQGFLFVCAFYGMKGGRALTEA
jgi:hypothetical protein